MSPCGCDRFEWFDDPAAHLYTKDFLERTGKDDSTGEVYYRCRACGTPWKRETPKGAKDMRLVKLPKTAIV